MYLKNRMVALDWIHLAEDRDLWRGFLNMVMIFSGVRKCGKFLD
jgi:hypothetical protein